MAFDTSNDYGEFDNVGSGESGTVEGLLPLEGAASAFRYRKVLQIYVAGAVADNFSQRIRGNWKVHIREDESRGSDGAYTGAILFAQEVFWTANVIAFNFGGITFTTWSPDGPAGSGNQKTTVCNGEECAAFENPNAATPQELEAYGVNGAWRFRDASNFNASATPGQKYDFERGFVAPETFTPEGIAAIGGVTFFCEWQSADYLCDIPEGAILETVFDHWQVGTIDDEATFKIAFKEGAALYDGVCDAWSGQIWHFHKQNGAMVCARERRFQSLGKSDADSEVLTGAFGTFRAMQNGHNLFVLHQRGDGVGLRYSIDDGQNWGGIEDMVTGIKQIDSVMDERGAQITMLGIAKTALDGIASGAIVRVVLTRTDEKDENGNPVFWKMRDVRACSFASEPPQKPAGRLTRTGTLLEWLIEGKEEVSLYVSTDEALSWTLVSAS